MCALSMERNSYRDVLIWSLWLLLLAGGLRVETWEFWFGAIAGAVGLAAIAGLALLIRNYLRLVRTVDRLTRQAERSARIVGVSMDALDDTPTQRAYSHAFKVELRRQLKDYYDESGIKELCYDLSIDYDELAGDTKTEKALELIKYLERNGGIHRLVRLMQQRRPIGGAQADIG